jgi:molybdopterin-guanine dinucleotide biosynthesis protein A
VLKINDKSKDIAFAVLIGGKSTRFGSDKGLYEFQGKPLVLYLLDTLNERSYDIFLVAHSPKQVQKYINKIDIRNIIAFILDDHKLIQNYMLHY